MRPPATAVARRGRPRLGLSGLVLWALASAACGSAQVPASPPPIVLITADGLRADFVGYLGGLPGLTPHLDRFLAGADLAVRAIAASTEPTAAALSLQTGLPPSQHGALHHAAADLPAARETIAETLVGRGYRTVAFVGGAWADPARGHAAGFEQWHALGSGRDAVDFARRLPDEPTFLWIDLDVPAPPLRRYPPLVPRLDALGEAVAVSDLPERIGAGELAAAMARPDGPDEKFRRAWFRLLCLNVARADVRIGELLEALESSPGGARAVVLVTSSRGERSGTDDAKGVPGSGALRRRWLEVPLGLRVGASLRPPPPAWRPGVPAVDRVHATLAEAAGAAPLPAAGASLWEEVDSALSESWAPGGERELSLVSVRQAVGPGEELLQVVVGGDGRSGWRWGSAGEAPLAPPEAIRLAEELQHHVLLNAGDVPIAEPPALRRAPVGGARR